MGFPSVQKHGSEDRNYPLGLQFAIRVFLVSDEGIPLPVMLITVNI